MNLFYVGTGRCILVYCVDVQSFLVMYVCTSIDSWDGRNVETKWVSANGTLHVHTHPAVVFGL